MELYNKSIKKKEKINKDVQLIFSQRLKVIYLYCKLMHVYIVVNIYIKSD